MKDLVGLLEDHIKYLQTELNEAHKLLNKMEVPTNGLDVDGNSGIGKREELSLKQRISYLKYDK